jgi:DNA-binding NarL/FixJ family response regulator
MAECRGVGGDLSHGASHQVDVDSGERRLPCESRATVDELADNLPDESRRAAFLRGALAQLPVPRPPSSLRLAREAFGGLTARERDVARRIAAGKSNRAIAEELVLGERTVESYVSNILDKLGFSSRAQIAGWAVSKGLA